MQDIRIIFGFVFDVKIEKYECGEKSRWTGSFWWIGWIFKNGLIIFVVKSKSAGKIDYWGFGLSADRIEMEVICRNMFQSWENGRLFCYERCFFPENQFIVSKMPSSSLFLTFSCRFNLYFDKRISPDEVPTGEAYRSTKRIKHKYI